MSGRMPRKPCPECGASMPVYPSGWIMAHGPGRSCPPPPPSSSSEIGILVAIRAKDHELLEQIDGYVERLLGIVDWEGEADSEIAWRASWTDLRAKMRGDL